MDQLIQTMIRYIFLCFTVLTLALGQAFAQKAEPTNIVVRAKAHDAKFIGTSMGGVMVAIRDARSGSLMAKGKIKGSTGNTENIMKTPRKRGTLLSKGGAAKFDTTLMLEEPTLVTIEAKGPLGQPQSAILTSTEVWLVPGKDIDEDGIILDFPGFAVDLMTPRAHTLIKKDEKVEIKANVVKMCGCPTTPGGLWNSNDYEIRAWIKKDGVWVDKVSMTYAGQTSLYSGSFEPTTSGTYEVTLVAFDPQSNNTGVDRTTFIYE